MDFGTVAVDTAAVAITEASSSQLTTNPLSRINSSATPTNRGFGISSVTKTSDWIPYPSERCSR